jgi:hypothetical protein
MPKRLVWREGDLYGKSDGFICGQIVKVLGNGDCFYRAVSEALKYCGIVLPKAWESDPTRKFKRWLIDELEKRLDWSVPYQHGLTVEEMAVNATTALLRRAKEYKVQGSKVDSSGKVIIETGVQTATVDRDLVKKLLGGGRKTRCLVTDEYLEMDQCVDNLLTNTAPTTTCTVDKVKLREMFFKYVRINKAYAEEPVLSAMAFFGGVNIIVYAREGKDLVFQPLASLLMAGDCGRVAIILVMDMVSQHYDWFQWITARAANEN